MTGHFFGQFSGLPFGTVAEAYDRIRPGYPDALVDAVLAGAFPAGAPYGAAAEAGAGTGIATRAFASRGVDVTAYEPDPQMASLAQVRCAGLPVHIEQARFEDASAAGFPLVFSAQAWHWVAPAARCDVAAAVLRPGGTIALFWNADRLADPGVQARVDAAYAAIAPINDWSIDPVRQADLMAHWPAVELVAHPAFGNVTARVFRWERVLPRADYLTYLATHSSFLRLDDDRRTRLLEAIGDAVPDDVRLAEDTTLYQATRV
jgi:SAM-dependent methyltransferase